MTANTQRKIRIIVVDSLATSQRAETPGHAKFRFRKSKRGRVRLVAGQESNHLIGKWGKTKQKQKQKQKQWKDPGRERSRVAQCGKFVVGPAKPGAGATTDGHFHCFVDC